MLLCVVEVIIKCERLLSVRDEYRTVHVGNKCATYARHLSSKHSDICEFLFFLLFHPISLKTQPSISFSE